MNALNMNGVSFQYICVCGVFSVDLSWGGGGLDYNVLFHVIVKKI